MDWIAQHQSQFLSPSSFLPNYHFPQGYTKQARNRIPGPTTRYLRYPFIVSSKNGRSLYYPRPSSQNTLGTLSEFISDTKSVDTYPNIHMFWHIFGILALLRIGYELPLSEGPGFEQGSVAFGLGGSPDTFCEGLCWAGLKYELAYACWGVKK
jgi:hypothetical protein